MRVAVYCDLRYQRRGGAVYCDEAFARFAAGLAGFADQLVLAGRLCQDGGRPFAHRLPDGVEFQPLPDYPALFRAAPAARATAASLLPLWRLLGTVDAVWLLGPHPLAIVCAPMALARRRRVVLGVREDLVAYVGLRHSGPLRRAAAWALDRGWRLLARALPVVVVGDALAARYRHGRSVVPIVVSLVGPEEPGARARAPARAYDGTLVVLAIGRLDPEKNPLLLADVLAGLQAHEDRWRLAVYGSGRLQDALAGRLAQLRLDDRALLGGVVGDDVLRSRYAASHALLHVSWTEGVPQVLFEAWAAGLPVVATDVGGVAGVARGAALLIPPGDAGAAVRALERIAHDAALRDALVRAGFERIRRHSAAAECGRVAAVLRGRAG